MSKHSDSRRNFLRQLSCTLCAGGASAFLPQLELISSAAAQGSVGGYRALVCVYLAGGNDSWNMVVPYDQARYDVYAASRSGVYNANNNTGGLALARPGNTNMNITDAGGSGTYFMHPALTELRTLYNQGRLAFLPNIGTLVRPITKAEYNANASLRPPQLYSHNDQENFWHLGRAAPHNRGWGGLVADRVRGDNLYQALSPCISIGGANRFEMGVQTFPYQMSSSGVSALSGINATGANAQREIALGQLLDASYASPYQQEYASILKRSRELYNTLNVGLGTGGAGANAFFDTPFNGVTQSSLRDQLRMVARMIKLSRTIGAGVEHKRQIFYVRYGGFDLHDNLITNNGHQNLLLRVSQALNGFWKALEAIGATNEVTTFTMSEFARTLSTNGNGSDHGWGGIQLVMGGAVQGGRFYGTWPDQTLNGPVSFTRGQTIPSTSVDQMGATLARWMGVTSDAELNTIFPNLPNFSTNNLGFMQA
ncbi:MAG TPA: DUF1501 domain-containing protein [Dokdonella sp.]|uniref:DUF1501 domain-containing protein n=1 Tax=Dokdonella sp. TaxID=2291710 RepID=UPI0025B85B77|nr:DUF1501 domain-containing protein [Dokdonella sp.]MBX3692558.1 DUF1501 domain-containing protein [Dokdonella sp.]MCW5567405.1 DUF1501 domain-containing protein [Dokdonella sp.]HNR91664.1 DUF1501 domain-containing protein [Dokdonella sp.]